ncbi:MAG: hypothetical protein A3F83_05640 [Candidatus Glassbacteria bacterium RIFCSPLOWO2_12_FULL_58_11]|uniref:Methyltransferase type 11 domain-containing protein n=1 Tax=Candidatus Glassbacteria bacterium RIFCSPLOWO2_12_FULL_58_11 TaxID=1817867 RepID=A0A1F5Z0Z1_9BACT|nr:MAG: hypothetical protein A3F83_05640 [Candidatus Glassbacteria bacterium RIFCSPLOWO2_12_FULL_58_11]
MDTIKKTHRDYQAIIGGTAASSRNYLEKRWNQYYFKTYKHVVSRMIGGLESCAGKTVLDVGTSHGNWYSFLKGQGFANLLGVELDPGRAELAKKSGYTEVYNCDAANIPLPDKSVDLAVSNDVFVHILQLEDKAAVLKEIQRVLKPGGVFIFNQTMSPAHGVRNFTIDKHCSYLNLDELIRLVTENTGFSIEDIKPTYFSFGNKHFSLIANILRHSFILIPGGVSLRFRRDLLLSGILSLEQSDSVYLKLRK